MLVYFKIQIHVKACLIQRSNTFAEIPGKSWIIVFGKDPKHDFTPMVIWEQSYPCRMIITILALSENCEPISLSLEQKKHVTKAFAHIMQ